MISQAALEEAVLALLCFSKEQAPTLALRLSSNLFSTRTNKTIAQTALDYIEKYKTSPSGQLEYLLENELRRGEEGKLLGQTLGILEKQASQLQPSFVFEQLETFISSQELNASLLEALELIQQGEIEKAREIVYKKSTAKVESNEIWIKDPKQAFSFLDRQEEDYFSSGIQILDEFGVRPARKTISFMIASTGKGKTWYLVEVGKSGLQHHRRVVHITLEVSSELTSRRYLQALFSLTRDETSKIQARYFERDEQGTFSMDVREVIRDPVISRKREISKRLSEMKSYPNLVIKEFPTSSLSISQLNLYLEYLEREKKFKPDLLIIDYADLMRIDSKDLRIDTGRLYRELRGISVERDLALVTATQGNRESADAKVVDITNVSEDWSKIGTGDLVLTYSQTIPEKKLGLARILVAKSRSTRDRFFVLISQAYEIGQFCLDSTWMAAEVTQEIKRLSE